MEEINGSLEATMHRRGNRIIRIVYVMSIVYELYEIKARNDDYEVSLPGNFGLLRKLEYKSLFSLHCNVTALIS
jgi:hypothetical protein